MSHDEAFLLMCSHIPEIEFLVGLVEKLVVVLTDPGIRGAGVLLGSENVSVGLDSVQEFLRVAITPKFIPNVLLVF